jgi:hypothetical protein
MSLLHGLAIIITSLLLIPFILKLVIILMIIWSFIISWNRTRLKHAMSIVELGCRMHNSFWAKTRNNEYHELRILGSTVVTSWLICLHTKSISNQTINALIWRWEYDEEAYSQLARTLRLYKPQNMTN